MTKDIQLLLNAHNMVFRSTNIELYSVARSNLNWGIRDTKGAYKERIERHFDNSDPCQTWQGIRHTTNYKDTTNPTSNNSTSLLEQLHHFFGHHEVERRETAMLTAPAPAPKTRTLIIQTADVIGTLRNVNIWKAAGPDGFAETVLLS